MNSRKGALLHQRSSKWFHRLEVRMVDFQSAYVGSNPTGITDKGNSMMNKQEGVPDKKTGLTAALSAEEIAKQNKAFRRMSKKRQRLAIANDVLAQLKAKKYVATRGTYHAIDKHLYWSDPYGEYQKAYLSMEIDMQKALLKNTVACEVCGLGAAFCSLSRLGNEIRWDEDDHQVLYPIFSKDQIDMIETAFEGWGKETVSYNGMNLDDSIIKKTMRFYRKYPDDNKRLAAIFRNIIRHDGIFTL